MNAKVKWVEKMQFVGNGPSKHTLVMDAHPEVGGEDSGVRPMELLLIGLGGCTGMDVVSLLNKMRVKFTHFEIEIKSERDTVHPKVFKKIRLNYIIKGNEIPEDKLKKAIELSQQRYCSASAMLGKTAELDYTYSIIKSNGSMQNAD